MKQTFAARHDEEQQRKRFLFLTAVLHQREYRRQSWEEAYKTVRAFYRDHLVPFSSLNAVQMEYTRLKKDEDQVATLKNAMYLLRQDHDISDEIHAEFQELSEGGLDLADTGMCVTDDDHINRAIDGDSEERAMARELFFETYADEILETVGIPDASAERREDLLGLIRELVVAWKDHQGSE